MLSFLCAMIFTHLLHGCTAVHAQPVATMLSPSQNFLTSPNTTINELDGTVVDTSFVTVRAFDCS